MFSILAFVLFLGEDCLEESVLLFEVVEFFLNYLNLFYGCFVEMLFHIGLKVEALAFIVFEFESATVDCLLGIYYHLSQLLGPFCQQPQN